MSHLNVHIYEYKRGVRRLVLHTAPIEERGFIEKRLSRYGLAHHVVPVGERKINVFFGDDCCVEVIRSIGKPRLCDYTPEEDFLLGAMLGYDLAAQCDRYLGRKKKQHTCIEDAKSDLIPRCREVRSCP